MSSLDLLQAFGRAVWAVSQFLAPVFYVGYLVLAAIARVLDPILV